MFPFIIPLFISDQITSFMLKSPAIIIFAEVLARSTRRSRGIRVASAIEFSVCVCSLYVTNFLILLQHNIRPSSRDCSPCAMEFAAGVILKRHVPPEL